MSAVGWLICVQVLLTLLILALIRFRPRPKKRPEVVVFSKAWVLSHAQIAAAFQEWPETDLHWRAVWEWLGTTYEEEMLAIMGQGNSHEELLMWKGRIQMLMHLRASMLEYCRQGKEGK